MDIIIALLTGVVSAFIYSAIQQVISYFQWEKTRNYYISEIRNAAVLINYYILDILNIDSIYDDGFESDHLITNEELMQEIDDVNIDGEQLKKLNKALKYTSQKIRMIRKDALLVPIFSSKDFHMADRIINEINRFTSSYSWLSEEIEKKDVSDRFKSKLIDIIKVVEDGKNNVNFLDKIARWRRRMKYKRSIKVKDNLPF